ncbi:unnamed protein product [Sphagnum jensenii]|uniref:Uncharacterized protein n=1 Tax=Sphagnum jensenii TaxID=128206 RepID=A0ABP1B646_9BRYO
MGCGLKAIFFYKWDMKKIAQLWREVQICDNQMAVIKFATMRDSEAGNSESFQVVLCQELCPKVSQHQLKLMRLIVGVGPRSIDGNLKEVLYQRRWNRWAAAEDSPQINLLGCQPVSVPMAWISQSMVAGAVAGVDRFTVQTGRYGNVWHAIRKITQEEGIEAFYNGLVPTIIGLVPNCAAYYFVYDSLTCSYRHYSNKKQLGNLETLTFGAFAGLASSAAMFPFAVAWKWLMVEAIAGGKITPRNIEQCANM